MTSSYSSPKHHCALTALSNTSIVCDHAATLNILFFPLSSCCSHFLKLFFDYFRWIFLSQILAWLHKHKFSLYFSLLYYFSPKNTVCKLTVHQQREGSRVRNQILLSSVQEICMYSEVFAQLWLNGPNTGITSWNHNSMTVFRKQNKALLTMDRLHTNNFKVTRKSTNKNSMEQAALWIYTWVTMKFLERFQAQLPAMNNC